MNRSIAIVLSIFLVVLAGNSVLAQPDPNNSTATSAGGTVLTCPLGDGVALSAVGAQVNINVRDVANNPISGYPPNLIWLDDPFGNVFRCLNGSNPANPTDAAGNTVISGPLATGGWTMTGLQVYLNGTPLNGPVLPVSVNSPDMLGDGIVNLCDVNEFALAFTTPYAFRADFIPDGILNLSDIAAFTQHLCHNCGGAVVGAIHPVQGNIGIFFDPAGPPFTQTTLATPVGVPFTFWIVVNGVPGLRSIDAPLRVDPGITILNVTPAAGAIGAVLGPEILFGAGCLNAPTQTVLAQVTAVTTLPGAQRIAFGTPATSCSTVPGPVYGTCTAGVCGLRKFQQEGRGTVNGTNNVVAPAVSSATLNAPAAWLYTCPGGDGPRLDSFGWAITAVVVDVAGSVVTGLNESDFEIDASPPGTFAIADCQFQTAEFTEGPPGTYRFIGRIAAGGWTAATLQLKVQGVFIPTALPIQVNSPDINGDGIVNLADVGAFAADYVTGYAFRSDFNGDGVLNLIDVAVMAAHFGHGPPCIPDPVD